MTSSLARQLGNDPAAFLGASPTMTLFDRAEPSTCLTVCLVRRGGDFAGYVADGGVLVDRLRLGVRPAFLCEVGGQLFEGELEVRVGSVPASGDAPDAALRRWGDRHPVLVVVQVKSLAPTALDPSPGSIPRT